jgi:hypothetical protein
MQWKLGGQQDKRLQDQRQYPRGAAVLDSSRFRLEHCLIVQEIIKWKLELPILTFLPYHTSYRFRNFPSLSLPSDRISHVLPATRYHIISLTASRHNHA